VRHGWQVRRAGRRIGGARSVRRSTGRGHALKRPMKIAKGARRNRGPFAEIEEALDAIRAGRLVIVVDDADRENEGDLTIAAEKVTPETINFMARYGRGL